MRILYTIGRYWPTVGGAELYTRELLAHLTGRHQAMVACLRNDNYCREWLDGFTVHPQKRQRPYRDGPVEIRVVRLPFLARLGLERRLAGFYASQARRISCNRMLARLFSRELRKLKAPCDLVHNTFVGEEFFSLASLDYARERGVPFVLTPLSHPDGWKGEIFSHLYCSADALIAMTEAEKEFLVSQGAPAERIHVTGLGQTLRHTEPGEDVRHTLGIDGPLVLFLGQKHYWKGCAQMCEAADLVWRRHPRTHFVFAGPPTPHSETLFASRRDGRITELGIVSEERKSALLAACDVFCMPSTYESFGIVYLEAWWFRKPVIAADTPTSRCIFTHGRDGLLVAQDPAAIAGALDLLLGDAALRHTLGEHGHEKLASRYSWPTIAAGVDTAYRLAVEGTHDSPRPKERR